MALSKTLKFAEVDCTAGSSSTDGAATPLELHKVEGLAGQGGDPAGRREQ